MKIVTLLTLLLTQMGPTFAANICNYPDGERNIAAANNCQRMTGKSWSCETNRCLNTQEAVNRRGEFQACSKLTGKEEQKKCYDDKAAEYAAKDGANLGVGETGGSLQQLEALVITSIVIGLAGQSALFSNCMSAKIFAGGAVLGIFNEINMYKKLKSSSNELQRKYDEVAKNSYDAQLKAFEYLREGQSLVKSAAENKEKNHNMVALVYGIAAVVGVLEATGKMGVEKCKTDFENAYKTPMSVSYFDPYASQIIANQNRILSDNNLSIYSSTHSSTFYSELFNKIPNEMKLSLMNKIIRVQEWLIPSLYAADQGASNSLRKMSENEKKYLNLLGLGAGVGGLVSGMVGKLVPFLSHPYVLAGFATSAVVINTTLAGKYGSVQSQASANIQKLDKIIETFKNSMSQLCPNGRENLRDPRCYCTLENGQRNPGRTNSQTCQVYWAKLDAKWFVASDYYGRTAEGGRRGCVTVNGAFDQDCRCKQMINTQTKQNGCLKVSLGGVNLGGLNNALGMQSTLDQMNGAFSGNLGLGTLNANALGASNAKAQKVVSDMIDQTNKKLLSEGKSPLPKADDLANKLLSSGGIKELAQNSDVKKLSPDAAMLAYAPSLNSDNQALKEAIKEAGLIDESTGKGLRRGKESKKEGNNFNFAAGSDSGTSSTTLTFDEPAMKREYDYKGSDISSDEDTPIWNIISARYLNSGLRRLFDDETVSE